MSEVIKCLVVKYDKTMYLVNKECVSYEDYSQFTDNFYNESGYCKEDELDLCVVMEDNEQSFIEMMQQYFKDTSHSKIKLAEMSEWNAEELKELLSSCGFFEANELCLDGNIFAGQLQKIELVNKSFGYKPTLNMKVHLFSKYNVEATIKEKNNDNGSDGDFHQYCCDAVANKE